MSSTLIQKVCIVNQGTSTVGNVLIEGNYISKISKLSHFQTLKCVLSHGDNEKCFLTIGKFRLESNFLCKFFNFFEKIVV